MGIRRRTILWIVLGIVLLPIVLIGGLVAYLLWWPAEQEPQSQLIGPPAKVSVTSGRGQVTVSWEAVPGAVSYQVLRSDRQDGGYEPVGGAVAGAPLLVRRVMDLLLPGEAFARFPRSPSVDTFVIPGRTYHYRVRANDGSLWSSLSAPVAATVPAGSGEGREARVNITVDASREIGTLEHKWEVMLGSEHLSYMLKGDLSPNLKTVGAGLRQAHKKLHDEFGIQYIRAHGILMDDLGAYKEDSSGNPVYDWAGIDKVYDMLRADGLKPMVELSFMPAALAANPKKKTVFYYQGISSPPKDYAKWGALVAELAKHLMARYGREEVESWPFEVWNEPDFRAGWPVSFWSGTDDDYFRLYDFAAQALKSVNPKLRVGGPAAAFPQFVEPFLRHATTQNYATGGSSTPVDFLAVHTYYCPPPDWRPLLERYGLKGLPIIYTEWGVSPQWGVPANDAPYGAAWLVRGLFESLGHISVIAYWTGSDYFEEFGTPKKFFHGGFGLLGLDGIRKPRYWAYHLLHQLGTRRLALEGQGDGFGGLIQGWATHADDGAVRILLWNVTFEQSKANGSAALARQVALRVDGLPKAKTFRLQHYRVDNIHSNVLAAWQAMGKPDWPSAEQMAELHRSDALETLEPAREVSSDSAGQFQTEFELPMPALSLIELVPAA